MLLIVPLVVAILWLRFFGLPDQVKTYLLQELERRGLAVSVDRLLLDPTGGVLAERLTVFRGMDRQEVWLQVDRARIGFAWLSWWQGKPFIDRASVSNAEINLPIGPHESVKLRQVNANAILGANRIEVLFAEARLLNLHLVLKGNIHLNGFPPSHPPTPEEVAGREKLWATIEDYADELDTEKPIHLQVDFDIPTKDPQTARVELGLKTQLIRFRGAQIQEVNLNAHMGDAKVVLDQFQIRLARGEFLMTGQWDLVGRKASIEFNSNLDFSPLAPAFPEPARTAISNLNFNQLPSFGGQVGLDWTQKLTYTVQADIDWRDFSYGGVPFDRLVIPLAYDGHRLLIPDARIENQTGKLAFDFFLDQSKPELKARVDSTLDPTAFRGAFGVAADRFLNSLEFRQNGPHLQAIVQGNGFKTNDISASGQLTVNDFSYKQVAIVSASAELTFSQGILGVNHMVVKRTEGQATGGIEYDFPNRKVAIKNLEASVNAQEIAPILGPKFVEYVRPYVFDKPAQVKVDGLVDLNDAKPELDTSLMVDIDSNSVLHYEFLKIPFQFYNAKGQLRFKGRHLTVKIIQSDFMDGTLNGILGIDLVKEPAYDTTIILTNTNFDKIMQTLYKHEGSSGTLNGHAHLTGTLGKMQTMKGSGDLSITEGYLFSIPFLGELSKLLNSVIPNFGYAKTKDAHCSFDIADGFLNTQDLEIDSATFAVIGKGRHNFVNDDLDMDMRVNMRGLPGLLTFPFSKLFEYHGSGSLKAPKWELKNL